MDAKQVILTVVTAILIPAVIAEVRFRIRWAARLNKIEEFHSFLKTYLLKDAVLTYRSNPNPKTDQIIDKIVAGEPVSENEVRQLKEKIERIATSADDKKQQAKAEATLELMKWVFEDLEPVEQRRDARDRLFNE